ncbi:IS5 family transposase, partial [Neisseria iguanae]
MGRFFKQTAEAMLAKHTGHFPLLKAHIITGFRQPLSRTAKSRYARHNGSRPPCS